MGVKKNVIVIDIDALMPSRTGFGGNKDFITPNINFLSKEGINFSNTFTMGNPTEFALPGLFASSYLLDNGGYRNGISNCQKTMAEIMQDEGYQTASFFSVFRPKKDSYQRGFDQFYLLYDLVVTEKNLYNTINWYRQEFKQNKITKEFCFSKIDEYYLEYLEDINNFCNYWIEYKKNSNIPFSKIFHNFDYESFLHNLLTHKKDYQKNSIGFITEYLDTGEIYLSKIIRKQNLKRNKLFKFSSFYLKFSFLLLRNAYFIMRSCSNYRLCKETVMLTVDRIINGPNKLLMRYASGRYLFKSFKGWLENELVKDKFYVYIKLVDAHEQSFYTQDTNANEDNEYNDIKKFISDLKREDSYTGNLLYDCSIKYTDTVIGEFLNLLKSHNKLEETIIVITADHGGQFTNFPPRDEKIHRLSTFFDELYHIPFIIYSPGIKKELNQNLFSSVDINSTILDLINSNSPKSFRGISALKNSDGREYILAENQGRGPCDLKNKPIMVCVRSKDYKIVYEKSPHVNESDKVRELYHIKKDTLEENNLSESSFHLREVDWMIDKARERVNEILT